MANRYDITKPVADQLRAVRDDHLMATPDKTDTAYAVMTRAADTLAELLEALQGAIGALEFSQDFHRDLGNEEQAFAADRLDAARAAIAKALGEGQ